MKISLIGPGRMGSGIASRLLEHGYELNIFARSPEKAESLKVRGAKLHTNVSEAVQDCHVVITMLPSDTALEEVALSKGGLIDTLPANACHMMMGTHGIDIVRKLSEQHKSKNQILVATPVLGRPDLAATGQVSVVAAGPDQQLEMLKPVFEVIGKQTFIAGVNPETATAVKIANNFVLGCAIETMGEAMSLVRKLGVEPHMFQEVLVKGLFSAPAYEVYGKMIADEAYESIGATAVIGLKDMNLALSAAEAAEMPLPSANVFRDRLLGAIARGESELDWCVAAREQARASGLDS